METFNIHVIEVPEVEDRDNGEKAIWGEIQTKNFPKSVKKKIIMSQIQETCCCFITLKTDQQG